MSSSKIPWPTNGQTQEEYVGPYIKAYRQKEKEYEDFVVAHPKDVQQHTDEFWKYNQAALLAKTQLAIANHQWKIRQEDLAAKEAKKKKKSSGATTTAITKKNPSQHTSKGSVGNKIPSVSASTSDEPPSPPAGISKNPDNKTKTTTTEKKKKKSLKEMLNEKAGKYYGMNRDEYWTAAQPIAKQAGSNWIEKNIGKVEHPKITDDVRDRLDRTVNNDWNYKIKNSRTSLMENLKKQGWDVPSDEAGQQALYERVQQESPDLFYQGMYVGTDPNSIKNAKRAFQLAYDSGQRVEANKKKREEAAKALTEEQKQKQQTEKLGQTLSDLATQAVDAKLQSMMSDNVKAVLAKYGYDWTAQGCIDAVKDTIRAFHYAKYMSQDQLDKLKKETYDSLSTIIDEQTDRVIDRYGTELMKTRIDPILGEVDYKAKQLIEQTGKKIQDFETKYQVKMAMLMKIGDDIGGSVDHFNKSVEAKLAKYGISVDMTEVTNPVVKKVSSQINDSITSSKFGQRYLNTKGQVSAVYQAVTRYKSMIDSYQKSARALVQKWINVIKDKVRATTERLLKSLLSRVNVSCGCIKLKF